MLKRNLQTIQLKLSDLEEYDAVRRRNKLKAAIDAGRASSGTATATETAPSSSSTSTSETPVTQRTVQDRVVVPGWKTAVITDSTTNTNSGSGSTEDDTSVAAVVDDNDTIAELSDDGWVDMDDEDGAQGGEP